MSDTSPTNGWDVLNNFLNFIKEITHTLLAVAVLSWPIWAGLIVMLVLHSIGALEQ